MPLCLPGPSYRVANNSPRTSSFASRNAVCGHPGRFRLAAPSQASSQKLCAGGVRARWRVAVRFISRSPLHATQAGVLARESRNVRWPQGYSRSGTRHTDCPERVRRRIARQFRATAHPLLDTSETTVELESLVKLAIVKLSTIDIPVLQEYLERHPANGRLRLETGHSMRGAFFSPSSLSSNCCFWLKF